MVSLLMPLAVLVCYSILLRLSRAHHHPPSISFYMLIGIWLFASSAMLLSTAFSGGATGPTAENIALIALGLLPPYTLMMATYDGSLLALISATMLMLLMHFMFERDRWIVPVRLLKI
jgi:hypothetical protein